MNDPLLGDGLRSVAIAILITLAVTTFLSLLHNAGFCRFGKQLAQLIEHDAAISFVSDEDGRVLNVNKVGRGRMGRRSATLATVLEDVFANPECVLKRLQTVARERQAAWEEVATRKGPIRLYVHRIGRRRFLWRAEELGHGSSKTHAGLGLPMLTVGRGNAILFMNEAARNFVGERVRSLDNVFQQLPVKDDSFNMVQSKAGLRNCLVHRLQRSAHRQELYFLPITPEDQVLEAGRAAFDALPVAVMRLDQSGKIVQSNRLARELLDLPPDSSATLADLVEGLGRPIADWLTEAVEGRGLNASEFLTLKGSDPERFVQLSLNRVQESKGVGLIAVMHDATELKSLEARFVQSQKMQAVGELAGGVAHDFNNLLTAISGHCDLLLLRHDLNDTDYADLVQISQNANRAAALVNQLLAFSRKQTLKPEPVDIRETLADLTHLLNRLVGEKTKLVLRSDPALWNLRADKRQLEQVLLNLVVNARDAMADGGEIRIESRNYTLAEPMERDSVKVPSGDYLMIQVADQGCGIPADKLQKVFEPFYTTKRTGEGTGLGLSTVYGIVKQSGGFVFIDSELERGTTFTLLFPASSEPVPRHSETPEASPQLPEPQDGVVLLVEDEAPVRAFASRALALQGYSVIEAGDAEEALELLQDGSLHVDIIVTDVIMPGMDGPTWVRKALLDRPEMRVVFVSGYAEDAFANGQADIPNSTFLAKPFSLNDLTGVVRTQLH